MALTPENTARLQAIQAKVLAGEASLDDLKEGVQIMRQDRIGAQHASTASKTKAAVEKKVINPTEVLANLRAIGAKLQSGPVA